MTPAYVQSPYGETTIEFQNIESQCKSTPKYKKRQLSPAMIESQIEVLW